MDADQVVEGTTIGILEGLTPPPKGKPTNCVAIYGARGDFDSLVREVVQRIPKVDCRRWKREMNLSQAEVKRMVKAILEKLKELQVVFTARKGQWVLNTHLFRRWLRRSKQKAERRHASQAGSPPPSFVNRPRSLTAR